MTQQIYWHLATQFNLEMKHAKQSGTTIMEDEEYTPSESQVVWTFEKHTVIRCHPQLSKQFTSLIREGQALSIAETIDNLDVTVLEQDKMYSITEADFVPHNSAYTIRQLTGDDAVAFESFLAQCSEEDKQSGQVGLEDEAIFGVLDGERIIAVASSFEWNGFVDIGVLTDPAYRGKGVGKAVVASITQHYLQNEIDERLLLYRHETSNVGSGKIAHAIGWHQFATLDYIRFKETESA